LLTQSLSKSIQRELNSFYQKLQGEDFSIQHVTKGAFTQSRAKLKPEAFKELNDVGNRSFYENAPYVTWLDFRLLSVDGSTLVLPKHESIEQEFGLVKFGPYADAPRSVARISLLYDVLNLTTLDAEVGAYGTSEKQLAQRHFDKIKAGEDLVLFDRGYASLSLMFELQARQIHYCIRLREDWWLAVREMIDQGINDRTIVFQLPQKDKALLNKYNTKNDQIKCRLVVIDLPGGGKEALCTSVTEHAKLPYECFGQLYHCRWNIEEAYKLYKTKVQLENFSGKTAKAIKQDIFAKVFMMTTMAVMAFPMEEKIKREHLQSTQKKRKHPFKINRTNALALTKEILTSALILNKVKSALYAFDRIIKATLEIVRPNRNFERKKIKKKPPSMNYKSL
jgi:hypothetical protein